MTILSGESVRGLTQGSGCPLRGSDSDRRWVVGFRSLKTLTLLSSAPWCRPYGVWSTLDFRLRSRVVQNKHTRGDRTCGAVVQVRTTIRISIPRQAKERNCTSHEKEGADRIGESIRGDHLIKKRNGSTGAGEYHLRSPFITRCTLHNGKDKFGAYLASSGEGASACGNRDFVRVRIMQPDEGFTNDGLKLDSVGGHATVGLSKNQVIVSSVCSSVIHERSD